MATKRKNKNSFFTAGNYVDLGRISKYGNKFLEID